MSKITNKRTTLMDDWDDLGSKWYLMDCACSDPDDRLSIWIENDNNYKELGIRFNVKCKSPWEIKIFDLDIDDNPILYWIKDKINIIGCRLKLCYHSLFKGYVETESDFLFDDPEVVDNMVEILKEGKEFCWPEKSQSEL